MKLTQQPEIVTWPETHYAFIEKTGPFQNTAQQAWQELHQLVPGISEHNKITGYMSLYKVGPKVYRAGVSLAAEPKNLSEKLTYEKFKGGKYSLLRWSPKRKFKFEMTTALKITPTIREQRRRIS